MPSRLRKAIDAVKDQTSISLAKVSHANAADLEVMILKATRHDESPIDERYVQQIVSLISSNRAYAAACAQFTSKRIGKTRNWIVAIKSLTLVLQIFQNGDPYFPSEVLYAMKRGAKILNLSNFRDDSNSSPWDYTAFVRTFALYLDERLECFLVGKLQRRHRSGRRSDSISEMKPALLINTITYWQKLLDRATATRPTGAAKASLIVQIAFYLVVQESFDLYRDVSDGIALLLDSFFHLQYQSCARAFQICVKASKQFDELCCFYDSCKAMGVGRMSEYPSVQKISEELIETLQEFLKDQASFPLNGKCGAHLLLSPPPISKDPSPCPAETHDRSSRLCHRSTSLEDLMSVTDSSPPVSHEHIVESGSATMSTRHGGLDLVSLDVWPPEDVNEEQEHGGQTSINDQGDWWEAALMESASFSVKELPNNFLESRHLDPEFGGGMVANNPFLLDVAVADARSVAPTFQAMASDSLLDTEGALAMQKGDDPFAASPPSIVARLELNVEQNLLLEQQMWRKNQNKIIAKSDLKLDI